MPFSDQAQAVNPALHQTLNRLRHLSQCPVQATWHQAPASTASPPTDSPWQGWPLAQLNHRDHMAWARGQVPLWLHQRFTWPTDLHGYPLQGLCARLALRWWADQAEVYVNGNLVHTGDIFDCWTRLGLTAQVVPGAWVDVSLKLVSPGHDEGALVTAQLVFESPDWETPEPSFVADELTVLATYLRQFAPQHLPRLEQAVGAIAWEQVSDRVAFDQSLAHLRASLQDLSPWLKQRTIHCLGHAHLDLAWLWPIADTWEAAERTFASVLALQADFPELTFSHSSPALFDWLEQHRPQLFQAIQQQVQAGRWAIDAGLWVEPDLNLPGGEAIARQILYGQRYCAAKFGQISAIAWLPDSFGFSWQLPQLLTQGGIRYFATQKLRWNDTNPFPHHLFRWQGLDGTTIPSVTLPPIGTDIEPVEMAQYAADWETNTGCMDALWLPGVGDHGGGPTRDMLLKARRWASSPFFPSLVFSHAVPLLDHILSHSPPGRTHRSAPTHPPIHPTTPPLPTRADTQVRPSPSTHPPIHPSTHPLSTWPDELYLELHRGCYTTHGDQKWYNRRCEDTLFQAELWATLATIQGLRPYPRTELETAWKQVLFNQFHDILPGSSIPEVFEDANQTWQAALDTGNRLLQEALEAIAQSLPLPAAPSSGAIPVLLFNPLNWERRQVITIPVPDLQANVTGWQAQDHWGNPLSSQRAQAPGLPSTPSTSVVGNAHPTPLTQQSGVTVLVDVADIPSIGYRLIWLVPTTNSPLQAPAPQDWILENSVLKATVDPTTGSIASLIHKPTGTETFSAPGNQLQAFRDQGQYWDAWNIAPDYSDHGLDRFELKQIEWIDSGPVRQTIRVVRHFRQSTFIQDYNLDYQSPILTIHTSVDWQETQVLVKAAFPLTVAADQATYEIPFGAIQRPTAPATPQDQAKWEVPALRWADLSQGDRGVSILTDYKHGFDASPSQLRLTLLKAPVWPDPGCDRGWQSFRYAIYPHPHSWQQAHTVRQARAFNQPLQPWFPPLVGASATPAPPTASFLDLGDNSLVLATLKLAEDNDQQLILRCYESLGNQPELALHSPFPLETWQPVNLLEQPQHTQPETATGAIAPWQVVSLAATWQAKLETL
ncbi:alpha-mannosidase [Nodosilinea sp. P-1105]|uniref:alpha-mannosidase n=1 Tax=Nodosilinea sp. P-1105 TaxID=2546229 RepID=UPI00146F3C5C|nr:alpha-mannosidase [Nodosilinea sp. P-1105]NMF85215.1 alpha-mannosidase [Nodosilinea sp. P-1105]